MVDTMISSHILVISLLLPFFQAQGTNEQTTSEDLRTITMINPQKYWDSQDVYDYWPLITIDPHREVPGEPTFGTEASDTTTESPAATTRGLLIPSGPCSRTDKTQEVNETNSGVFTVKTVIDVHYSDEDDDGEPREVVSTDDVSIVCSEGNSSGQQSLRDCKATITYNTVISKTREQKQGDSCV